MSLVSRTDYCAAQNERPLTGREAWIDRDTEILPGKSQEKTESGLPVER